MNCTLTRTLTPVCDLRRRLVADVEGRKGRKWLARRQSPRRTCRGSSLRLGVVTKKARSGIRLCRFRLVQTIN